MEFDWHLNEPPPLLEAHSKAKLDVLRCYLKAYYDTLNVHPQRDEFKLDLVDGFAGGGTYRFNGDITSGSPLIMLEEANNAKTRLNENRRKELKIDCKFYFSDKKQDHIDCLRKVLNEKGYSTDDGRIELINSHFEDVVKNIIDAIRTRQPRSGRAIFLLDQTGYKQVNFRLIHRIFAELPAAEVIMTFAVDALINFLKESPDMVKVLSPLELSNNQIEDLMNYKNGVGGRAIAQRTLLEHIKSVTGTPFYTPFFMKPEQSRRALWFVHLSRHPTARDVMVQQHWSNYNSIEHYGRGSLDILGWDALVADPNIQVPLFSFDDNDKNQMKKQLLEELPRELYGLASNEPVTIEALRYKIANNTAAPYAVLDDTILRLRNEREIELVNPDGKKHSPSLQLLKPTTRIAIPDSLSLFSRFRK